MNYLRERERIPQVSEHWNLQYIYGKHTDAQMLLDIQGARSLVTLWHEKNRIKASIWFDAFPDPLVLTGILPTGNDNGALEFQLFK